MSLSTKDETLDKNRLKFNVDNMFSLNSSSFPEIPSTKSSISSSVLSSCSNFPSAEDRAHFDEMLPDISELRERLTPTQLGKLEQVLIKNQGRSRLHQPRGASNRFGAQRSDLARRG